MLDAFDIMEITGLLKKQKQIQKHLRPSYGEMGLLLPTNVQGTLLVVCAEFLFQNPAVSSLRFGNLLPTRCVCSVCMSRVGASVSQDYKCIT